jgi:ribosomal-protein-alanine N-acetyltransferase
MIILETERLLIRDHIEEDLDDLFDLISRPFEMRYIMDLFVVEPKGAKENLAVAMRDIGKRNRKHYFFAIIEKETSKYVGEIGFTVLDENPSGKLLELGYFTKREFWGRGLTTEAVAICVDYAFKELNTWKITTGCIKENIASERIMIKLGFHKEGELRNHQSVDQEWKDRVIYGLLKSEYQMEA